MNTTQPEPRFYRKRPTPWPIRIFLVVAILFGIWADVSRDFATHDDGSSAAQTPLLGLAGDDSHVASLIRTLATRH